ncbi:MAG TPA: MOSC N-terminal beta barrel domain-containing protein [Candidatus Binataceae bacterium]|nr:MOSC N-terminal beta barrel domain-containing protein [Candidatus Binataceae bacterium]
MAQTQIGTIAAIWRHPVKSMLGEQLAQVEITERGAAGDRAWALREIATRRIASAKKFAGLYAFRATYDDPIAADGHSPVSIRLPDGRLIHAADPGASEEISAALGRTVVLERAETAVRERAGIDPKTVFADVPVEQVIPGLTAATLPADFSLAQGSFFDTAVMHVLATGTLRHLARLAGSKSIFDPRRFRPTLLVDTGAGDDRFVEDEWEGGELRVGAVVKIVAMVPALRCVMTTHPQDDLPRDFDVLRTSARHHRNNVGVFAQVGAGGVARIGDPVYLVK